MFERKKQAGKIYFLPIDQIRPSPFQARREFSEQELAALAQSIRENGLLQPISVRKVSDGGYELVAGERRLRACRLAKMNTIPAILCDYDDERTAALGLLENIQRADLNPFEQAQGLKDVMVLWDCTQAEAAKRLGMAQPTLANKLRLLQLNADQRQFVLDNSLTERHASCVCWQSVCGISSGSGWSLTRSARRSWLTTSTHICCFRWNRWPIWPAMAV